MTRTEPRWLTREQVEAIHAIQLELHGGLHGVRDAGALESALGRPQHRWHYELETDLAACAAAYGFAIAKNHGFADGNKRTALVAMGTFLALNRLNLDAPETDAVQLMLGVASGSITESELAEWLRRNTKRRK
jgi:death-on-curing protein